MRGEELVVRVPFIRVRRGLRVVFQAAGGKGVPGGPPTPLARCLVRAHFLDRALEDSGTFRSGRTQGAVSRQRLAQIHALAYLAPDLQEAVLMGTRAASRMDFHTLVRIARMPLWADQRKAWDGVVGAASSE